MIHSLKTKELEMLLNRADIVCSVDDDGDLFTLLEADEDFPYDVVLWFTLNSTGEIFTGVARCSDFEIEDVVRVANEYNRNHNFLTAIADEEEQTLGFDIGYNVKGLTEEYFLENCVNDFGAYVWRAYCELYKNKEN